MQGRAEVAKKHRKHRKQADTVSKSFRVEKFRIAAESVPIWLNLDEVSGWSVEQSWSVDAYRAAVKVRVSCGG